MRDSDSTVDFLHDFDDLKQRFLDVSFDHERLIDQPEPMLRNLLELSQAPGQSLNNEPVADTVAVLEKRLLDAVGPQRHEEALELIETGRVSWKLRDDDNLLVARLESQLLRALDEAAQRLKALDRLNGEVRPNVSHVEIVAGALREPSAGPITLEAPAENLTAELSCTASGETPRQLIGQPASPGAATGRVRCIRGRSDLGEFRQGEVLVCDAIQPTMTHLVPLASAIIARELGIPCVNGIRDAAEILKNGDLVTVDGHLGIVAVGAADFDLELGVKRS